MGKLIGEPSCRRRVYAQQATAACMLYEFGELYLERSNWWTRGGNHTNTHVNVKRGCGFVEELRVRDSDARTEFRKMTLTRHRFREALPECDPSLAPIPFLARTRHAAAARRQR